MYRHGAAAGGEPDEFNTWFDSGGGKVNAARRSREEEHLPVIHGADRPRVRRSKGVQRDGVGLLHFPGGVDLAVQDNEHAQVTGSAGTGYPDRIQQVPRPVGVLVTGRSLRRRKHDRTAGGQNEVQQEGRFLERVGAVRHHDAGQLGPLGKDRGDALGELELELRVHPRTADANEILGSDRSHGIDTRQGRREIAGVQRTSRTPGNRPSGADEMDFRERLSRRR